MGLCGAGPHLAKKHHLSSEASVCAKDCADVIIIDTKSFIE